MNVCVLLSESWLISKMDLGEISCEDVKWIELAQVCFCGSGAAASRLAE